MRISDWSSDVCSSDLAATPWGESHVPGHYWGEWTPESLRAAQMVWGHSLLGPCSPDELSLLAAWVKPRRGTRIALLGAGLGGFGLALRSEEHTSELQSLMRISYAVFCLKKKKNKRINE